MTDIGQTARIFIESQATGLPGEYAFYPGGQVSLYASCYAAMALHYIGHLKTLDAAVRQTWREYINSWQDAATGYYLGPELAPGQFTRPDMDATYARLHLIVHVLPAIEVLGGEPVHPLTFAHAFADADYLRDWLSQRNWHQAWLEGNNLLFVGQLLVHLRDREGYAPAVNALTLYFDWLDQQQDPATGLWGTNGYCDAYAALYGGYHQLLVYYACARPVRYAERIIDTVLALQQPDGSFTRTPGGGACEDVDAVDILVNLVKRTGYRLDDVRQALSNTIPHLLRQQAPDGGFVYRWGRSYMQSGVLRTFVPRDQPDVFSTWFRLHTLALINEVVEDPTLTAVDWHFNHSCSMGWHDRSRQVARRPAAPRTAAGQRTVPVPLKTRLAQQGYHLVQYLPQRPLLRFFEATLLRYLRALPAERSLPALLELEHALDRLGRERAYELGEGLEVHHWWSQAYSTYLAHLADSRLVVHLGCAEGSLSYTLASQSSAQIVAVDADPDQVELARKTLHHPRLVFLDRAELLRRIVAPDTVLLTDLVDGLPAWAHWQAEWYAWPGTTVLAQLSAFAKRWNQLPLAAASAVVQDVSTAQVSQLVPTGWRVLAAQRVYGALHARVMVSSDQQPAKGQAP